LNTDRLCLINIMLHFICVNIECNTSSMDSASVLLPVPMLSKYLNHLYSSHPSNRLWTIILLSHLPNNTFSQMQQDAHAMNSP
jgi:hypothetical protein